MTDLASRSRWGIAEPTIDEQTADALIAEFIGRRPDEGRHLARLRDYGVQVWALIGYLRGATIIETADAYGIPEQAMVAAVAYYRRHRELIDAQLLLMDEAWV